MAALADKGEFGHTLRRGDAPGVDVERRRAHGLAALQVERRLAIGRGKAQERHSHPP
jgi:hypothetical protein